MTIGFLRNTGAAADVKELEYVSAISQTCLKGGVRRDGSITDNDIVLFLLSRYGIDVTADDVRTNVIRGLGGGDEEQDDCIDLCEMMCMLMIPTLLKAVANDDDLPDGVVKPRDGLVNYVLSMILHDTTGSHVPKKLDKTLIQRILISYGETDLANNDALIDEMLEAAKTPDGTLNVEAFSNGLTHDVQLYDIGNEVRYSTNYDDVFLTKNHRDDWEGDRDDQDEESRRLEAERQKSLGKALNSRFTASAIDMVAGTFRSKVVMVLLWATYIISAFAYNGYGGEGVDVCSEEDASFQYGQSWTGEAAKPMACQVGSSVLGWLATFLGASLYGMMFIGCGSIGNKITCKRWWMPIFGIAFITLFTIGPYIDETIFVSRQASYLPTVSVVLGLLAAAFHLFHIIAMLAPKTWIESRSTRTQSLFASGIVRAETNIKRSAAHKISVMTDNAIDLAEKKDKDAVLETHFGQGLLAFEKLGKVFVPAGGFSWTWKRIYDGTLFREEGMWLSARLLASNVAQFIVVVFVLIAGIQITRNIEENYDLEKAQRVAGEYVDLLFNGSAADGMAAGMVADLSLVMTEYLAGSDLNETCGDYSFDESACELVDTYLSCGDGTSICDLLAYSQQTNSSLDGLTALGLLNASGLDANELVQVSQEYLVSAAQASVDSIYPREKYMVKVPAIIGTIVAFITALSLAVTYIPSVTSTTLKLRSGVIPSLRDPGFNRYRFAADQVTILTGSMFWGCFIAAVLVGGLCGLVVFLFLWQATISLVQRLVAIVIGICVVCLIKVALVMTCRSSYYEAFYRKKPAAANISALALEATNFSLSVGFVFLRMCKLLVTAALFVGRIDTPFLADGVGRLGPLELDNYPRIFLKDILAHEAHRHPFIELLGVMYLMKLRYGTHFGQRAGSTWRLLFVCALFPWLNKYRILERDELPGDDTKDDLELEEHDGEMDNEGAFEAVLPFERADVEAHLREGGDVRDRRAVHKRPSDLMTKFQSLRSTFKDDDDGQSSWNSQSSNQRRLSHRRSSQRSSLLVQELDVAQQGELQQRNAELEMKVVGLQSNVYELEAEVERLRQELGYRKRKRFHSSNGMEDLHELKGKPGVGRN